MAKTARQLVHDAFKAALRIDSLARVPRCINFTDPCDAVCNELTESVAFDRLLTKNERELEAFAAIQRSWVT